MTNLPSSSERPKHVVQSILVLLQTIGELCSPLPVLISLKRENSESPSNRTGSLTLDISVFPFDSSAVPIKYGVAGSINYGVLAIAMLEAGVAGDRLAIVVRARPASGIAFLVIVIRTATH